MYSNRMATNRTVDMRNPLIELRHAIKDDTAHEMIMGWLIIVAFPTGPNMDGRSITDSNGRKRKIYPRRNYSTTCLLSSMAITIS